MAKSDKKKSQEAAMEVSKLAIIENTKWLNGVLWAQVLIALAIVGAKILGFDTFKWNDIEITERSAWLPFAVLTGAHLYCTILLIQSLRRAQLVLDDVSKKLIFDTITATGGVFVRGMIPRLRSKDSNYADMNPSDPSGMAAVIALPIIVIAVVPFQIDKMMPFYLFLGFLLGNINWVIGSHWVIALSDFGIGSNRYFSEAPGGWTRILRAGGVSRPLPPRFKRTPLFQWLLYIIFGTFTLPFFVYIKCIQALAYLLRRPASGLQKAKSRRTSNRL
ncbi:MAG: hypothetical protein E5X57_19485 [Mesorhizobium sp.]|uniref:hypothetical protein n=1 Tax=Mesorhizobium sp. TaxID=1871066 RepID=UPI0011F73ABF|nr:hypothetical protein [Mesorhizobium sp.]TIQ09296.1 MAG: hypothetical protein E5X57_19485 [Mesorhizobium sp.]